MSETPAPYGDKPKYPPANKTPADGEYTFHVFKLGEWSVGKTAKGNGYVKVDLSAKCGARVKAKLFATEKAVRRSIDFIKACTPSADVSPSDIRDENDLAAAISTFCCGKKVKATVKRAQDSVFNGQSYPQYDVGGFSTPDPF